jgi:hypothetical protein
MWRSKQTKDKHMTLVFDDKKLEETARAVQSVNPYARNYPLQSLIDNMKETAIRAFEDGSNGYVSTLGFVLCVFQNPQGEREIYSSVGAYSVLEHVAGRQ